MKREIKQIVTIIIGLFLFLQSCSNLKFERKDFVGIWEAGDKATVELNEDSSTIIKDIDLSNIFYSKTNETIDFSGKWEFTTDMYKKQVIRINSRKYTFDFYISGQGTFGNKPPFDLYIFIGDPDEMNKYRFIKQL
ncbi:MAG: hypothetical protein ACK5L5_11820 [Bacteroidales bacterium]